MDELKCPKCGTTVSRMLLTPQTCFVCGYDGPDFVDVSDRAILMRICETGCNTAEQLKRAITIGESILARLDALEKRITPTDVDLISMCRQCDWDIKNCGEEPMDCYREFEAST